MTEIKYLFFTCFFIPILITYFLKSLNREPEPLILVKLVSIAAVKMKKRNQHTIPAVKLIDESRFLDKTWAFQYSERKWQRKRSQGMEATLSVTSFRPMGELSPQREITLNLKKKTTRPSRT